MAKDAVHAPRILSTGLIALAGGAGAASASQQVVSPGDPFSSCGYGTFGSQTVAADSELEPRVATDPVNKSDAIAVFQQDRWSGGGAKGVLASTSSDGGASWKEPMPSKQPAFSQCSDASSPYPRASDPWVSIGSNVDGTGTVAYFAALGLNGAETISSVQVSTSTTDGNSWNTPKILITDNSTSSTFVLDDKEAVTADPYRHGAAYVVWDRVALPQSQSNPNSDRSFAFRGTPMLSMTSDAGAHWSTPRSIMPTNANLFTIGNQIVVLPDASHTLVDVFQLSQGSGIQPSDQNWEAVLISKDGGATWAGPFKISKLDVIGVTNPDDGTKVRAGAGIPDISVDPGTGNLFVVWMDARFSAFHYDQIVLSESTDGGTGWSNPVVVNQTPASTTVGDNQAFTSVVHFRPSGGTLGVTYYDFRSGGSSTKFFIAECTSSCSSPAATWTETQIGGPFAIENAPFSTGRGWFLGDYTGLTDTVSKFLSVFGVAVTSANPTDIVSATSS
ncbi:MAG: exo-alpha-sialidase [Chloroflexi bacterium]|nr:MAG: exo-alpha-sialidase [Chloroflexota bacterium]